MGNEIITIERGVKNIDELIPMMNRVFHANFKRLLPKIYSSNVYAENHYAAYVNGKQAGSVGAIPNRLIFRNGESLKCLGISGVAVMRKYRGRGLMDKMMRQAMSDAKAECIDFLYLSGLRQRYERYGFVPGGFSYLFNITSKNVSAVPYKEDEYTFLRYIRAVHEEELAAFYNNASAHYERENFDDAVKSWNVTKYDITLVIKDSKTYGYIVCRGRTIVEMILEELDAASVLASYYRYKEFNGTLKVRLYSMNIAEIKSLSAIAEHYSIENSLSVAVLNYWNVIGTLLRQSPCGYDYEYVLEIENHGKRLIKECSGEITLEETEREPNLSLKENQAATALFSSASAAYNLPFTLRLSVPRQDDV